jgi:hypothetical protein
MMPAIFCRSAQRPSPCFLLGQIGAHYMAYSLFSQRNVRKHAKMGKVGDVFEAFSSSTPQGFIRQSRQPLGAWARNREA